MTESDPQTADATWYCLRKNGIAKRDGWIGARAPDDLPQRVGSEPDHVIEVCIAPDDLPQRVGSEPDHVIEVCIAKDFRSVPFDRFSRFFYNRVRGLVGMEMAYGGEVVRLAPTRMIAANLGFGRAMERFLERQNISKDEFAENGRLRAFSSKQYLVPGGGQTDRTELYRGSAIVASKPASDENRAADLANGIGRWMLRNQSPDGGLPYKYWPSRGRESPADNAIRRFLASLSLARLGELHADNEVRLAAQRNLDFNLKRYLKNLGDGRGAIVESTGAKLGAAALAALCILESPAFSDFRTEFDLLMAGVNSLADENLGFRTFFFPQERDGQNWNFYSGEALLFWAEALRRGAPGAPSVARCVETFAKCRERHLQARNPAFIPWHVQACASLFKQTGRSEFADFVFEISDWMLPMQQWDGMLPDLRGRFYDPRRPDFGPPHAASTGAYLEGMADALELARLSGDGSRATVYQRTLNRGLRSLRQLQFRDASDTFYISKKNRVKGALRTEVYDNSIRVDSAAHALAAAVKLLTQGRIHPAGGYT